MPAFVLYLPIPQNLQGSAPDGREKSLSRTMPPKIPCNAILTMNRRRPLTPAGGEINEQHLEDLPDQVFRGHIPLRGITQKTPSLQNTRSFFRESHDRQELVRYPWTHRSLAK